MIAESTVATQIVALHEGIVANLSKSLADAMKIGEMLEEVRQALPHGQWLRWRSANIPQISERSCRQYLRLHRNRSGLEGAESMRHALQLLTDRENETEFDRLKAVLVESMRKGLLQGIVLKVIRDTESYKDDHASFDEFLRAEAREADHLLPAEKAYELMTLAIEMADDEEYLRWWQERHGPISLEELEVA